MNSMIVLSALLGLACAVPQQTIVVDDGLVGHGGLGLGWNAAPAALAWNGHGVSTSYVSRVAHPSVHGGLLSSGIHGGLVRSWGAPVVRQVVAAPTVLRSSVVSHGVPTVLSSGHGIVAGPTVLSAGHGIGLSGIALNGHGLGLKNVW